MRTIEDIEKRLRENEVKDLEAYRLGNADAPMLYRPHGILKATQEDGQMLFVASEESDDRSGDVVAVSGWDLKNFKKNPVMMWAHDYGVAPVGTIPKVWVEGNQLLDAPLFDMADPLGAFLHGKYLRGIMKAQSVGFRPLEFEEISGKGMFGSYRFTKQELLEISLVPIPAHPAALRKGLEGGPFFMLVPDVKWVADEEPGEPEQGALDLGPTGSTSAPQGTPPAEGDAGAGLSAIELQAQIDGLKERVDGLAEKIEGSQPDEEPAPDADPEPIEEPVEAAVDWDEVTRALQGVSTKE
jgi:hypothetical protein